MLLTSERYLRVYPWYLPVGLNPAALLAAACKSPEDFTAYVGQNLDLYVLLQQLSKSFSRTTEGKGVTSEYFNVFKNLDDPHPNYCPDARDPETSLSALWHCLEKPNGTGLVYTLVGHDAAWSVSWPHILLSLDELLIAPAYTFRNNDDSIRHHHMQCIGWLGVLLLPTLRIYDPCAYELAIAKLYHAFFHNKPLLEQAHAAFIKDRSLISLDSFKGLASINYEYLSITYPGLREALLRLNAGFLKKSLKDEDVGIGYFATPEKFDPFVKAIRSQLLLVTPFIRHFPDTNESLMKTLEDWEISTSTLSGRFTDYNNLTKMQDIGVNAIDNIADTTDDILQRPVHLILAKVLKDSSVISLIRNARFLNHVYAQMSSIFGYFDQGSVAIRASVNKLLSPGFSYIKDDGSNTKVKSQLLPYLVHPISIGSNKIPDHGDISSLLHKLIFTISLTSFCSKYLTSFENAKDIPIVTLDYVNSPYKVLKHDVWTGKFDIPCDSQYSPVLTSRNFRRNTNHYLQAYTLSLAVSMFSWYHVVKRNNPDFQPADFSSDYNLTRFLQMVGVFVSPRLLYTPEEQPKGMFTLAINVPRYLSFRPRLLYTSEEQMFTLAINVPRYLSFLSRFMVMPKRLIAGLRGVADEQLTTRKPELTFSPIADSDYTTRLRYLTYRVMKDKFLSETVREVETAILRDTLPGILELENTRLNDNSIPQDSWYFGIVVPDLAKLLTSRFSLKLAPKIPKYLSKNANKPTHKLRASSSLLREPIPISVKLSVGNIVDDFVIKVLPVGGKVFFGLPWLAFFNISNLLPPDPSSVYAKSHMKITNKRGFYRQFYNTFLFGDLPSEEYVQKDVEGNLSAERQSLKKNVCVFMNTPYMFTLSKLETSLYGNGKNPLKFIPELRSILEQLSCMPAYQLRGLRIKEPKEPKEPRELSSSDFYQKNQRRKEVIKERLEGEGTTWTPKDPRLHFTPAEDQFLCMYYRPGMTPETREKLLTEWCAGHSWNVITKRAKFICEKLVREGVTDPSRLPYIRMTSSLKKLLNERHP